MISEPYVSLMDGKIIVGKVFDEAFDEAIQIWETEENQGRRRHLF